MTTYSSSDAYVEVDDVGGTPVDLSSFCDEVLYTYKAVYDYDITGGTSVSDFIHQVVLRGYYDDAPNTGVDDVLTRIVGTVVTVTLGPRGNETGVNKRKYTGEWLCNTYEVRAEVTNPVRFEAIFSYDSVLVITTW